MVDHQSLQLQILEKIRPSLLDLLGDRASTEPHDLLGLVFHNYRKQGTTSRGLRLSSVGHRLLSKHFHTHECELLDKYSHKVIILLDRYQTRPYYIGRKRIVFYDALDASMYKLVGHDIQQYAENLQED